MGHHYEFSYVLEEGLALLPGLLSMIPSGAINIAVYILTALSLYTIANRRGINHPWLSWVPVVNVWVLGSLSDQYRYVVKGEVKSKRKVLLVLNIISSVIACIIAVSALAMVGELITSSMYGRYDDDVWEDLIAPVFSIVALSLPLAGVAIASAVVRYMALYDLYTSCDPQNNVLFLVLSVLFGVTEPFFLFFSRNKDEGMPPRRQVPQYVPLQETWETQSQPQEDSDTIQF